MNNLFYSLPEELQMKITRMNPHPVADLFRVAKNKFDINIKYKSARTYLECYSKTHMCYGYCTLDAEFSTFSELVFDSIKLKMALRRFKKKQIKKPIIKTNT